MKNNVMFRTTVMLLAVLLLAVSFYAYPIAAQEKGPYVDEIVMVREPDSAKAFRRIEAGEIDMYLWYIKGDTARAAKESPNVKLLNAYSGVNDLFVNPVQFKEGFNPFAIREVREALNLLVDRDYIVTNIFKGFALPQYTVWQPVSPDYAREVAFIKKLEAKYRNDLGMAREMISQALKNAGAELVDGKWMYQGEPVKVIFYIRVEDERRQIGDYIADLLEQLGFTVQREYATGLKAFQVVYSGDPAAGTWNLYTEGWVFNAITSYDDTLPSFMFTSPGSGTVFNVYQPPEELTNVANKLAQAEYKSLEERSQLVQQVTELGTKDGVRVWLVTQVTPFPYAAKVTNVAGDLIGGAWSLFTLRTPRIVQAATAPGLFAPGPGSTLTVAQRTLFVSGWNTAPGESGFTWLYDALVRYAVSDPGVWPHPHTGRYIPIRAQFSVETAGPDGTLPVPSDAIIWDVEQQQWVNVGDGATARSKVTFTYDFGVWHHGQPITMADLLFGIATVLEVLNEKSKIYDPNVENPGLRTFVDKLVGVKQVDDNTLEVYINYWHPDSTFIAAQANVWEDTPWDVQALMNWVYENGQAAFSEAKAQELGVEQIDLAKGPTIPILKKALDQLMAMNYVPPALDGIITAGEAAARWKALRDWYDKRGHFFVSNGPYYLEKADPAAYQIIMKAFRDYVYGPDKWNELVTPKVPDISPELPPIVTVGEEALFIVSSSLAGAPYSDVKISYMIVDPLSGEIITSGDAKGIGAGKFAIGLPSSFTATLKPGTYEMVIVGVGVEAALPRVASTTFTVLPSVRAVEEKVTELEKRFSEQLAGLEDRIRAVSESLADAINELGQTMGSALDEIRAETTQLASKSDVNAVKSDVNTVRSTVETLSADVDELRSAISTLQTLLIIVVILALIGIVVPFVRKR
ncbi:MAG: ABC transporter substrate-binding protein [Aigarchaeota archaeon]|nr:ABC transporter substrate-binding protein [Candidatus Pelearchaeum maunauluense]